MAQSTHAWLTVTSLLISPNSLKVIGGKCERATPYNLAISIVLWTMHKTDAVNTESINAHATLYNLWNMVPWFIMKQV